MSAPPRFILYAHNATYDKLHQVATLALTASAMGKDVVVVLLFWTIKKLAEGKLDEIDFPPEYHHYHDEVARLLAERKVPLISEMLEEAQKVGTLRRIAWTKCPAPMAKASPSPPKTSVFRSGRASRTPVAMGMVRPWMP